MQVPKRSDAHLRMSHLLTDEIITRAFSEYEQVVLQFILRLSWGCGREWCHIPHLADFEAVGIHRQNVSLILEALHQENVIYWSKETNHFAFNKMSDHWMVSYRKPAVKKHGLIKELVHHNIKGQPPMPPPELLEMLSSHQRPVIKNITTEEGFEDDEIISPVIENITNNHLCVMESITQVVSEPATPKESILKKEEKEPLPTTTPVITAAAAAETIRSGVSDPDATKPWEPVSKNFGKACTIYQQNIGMLSPFIGQELDELCTTYEIHWIEEATKEAVRMNRRSLKYIAAILERWGRDGYKAPMPTKFEGLPGRPPKGQLPTGDELEQAWKRGKK